MDTLPIALVHRVWPQEELAPHTCLNMTQCNSMWKRDSWTRITKEFSFEIWSHIETLPISGTLLKQRLELFRTHMPQNSENRVFEMFKHVLASCFTLLHHFLLSFTYHFGSLHVLPRCHRFFQGWWQHWWPRRAVHAQPADAPATNDSWRTPNARTNQTNHLKEPYQSLSNHIIPWSLIIATRFLAVPSRSNSDTNRSNQAGWRRHVPQCMGQKFWPFRSFRIFDPVNRFVQRIWKKWIERVGNGSRLFPLQREREFRCSSLISWWIF